MTTEIMDCEACGEPQEAPEHIKEQDKKLSYLTDNACKSCFQEYFDWCEENDL